MFLGREGAVFIFVYESYPFKNRILAGLAER